MSLKNEIVNLYLHNLSGSYPVILTGDESYVMQDLCTVDENQYYQSQYIRVSSDGKVSTAVYATSENMDEFWENIYNIEWTDITETEAGTYV